MGIKKKHPCALYGKKFLSISAKRTIKDSNLRKSMTLNPVWQGMDLQETSEETHANSFWGESIL